MSEHIVTYGESVQVGEYEHKFIRLSKSITHETTVSDILEWLKSLGVKEPDLTMVDFSLIYDKTTPQPD